METFFQMGNNAQDVFDPSRHNIVAVDKVSKAHFHVTLDELARDARDVLGVTLELPAPAKAEPSTQIIEVVRHEPSEDVGELKRSVADLSRQCQAMAEALMVAHENSERQHDRIAGLEKLIAQILNTTVIVPEA